jgi:hypothetical protein
VKDSYSFQAGCRLPSETMRTRLGRASRPFFLLLISVPLCNFGAIAAQTQPTSQPTISFTKLLKGSVPEYVAITFDRTGAATYDGRKESESPAPRHFTLSTATTQRIFDLAGALDDFKSIDLESHKKVADLGAKTLTYQDGATKNHTEFNYTLNHDAQDLVNLFERISVVLQHVESLDYAMRYDHLGLPGELLQIQLDLQNKALTDPELMVPQLEKIIRDSRFMRLAQIRAQDILQQVQTRN